MKDFDDYKTVAKKQSDAIKDESLYKAYRSTLPDNLKNTKDADFEEGGTYRSRRYWELNGKPLNFQEGVIKGMFNKEKDGYHSSSVAYNKDADEYEFMKLPNHSTINMELDWYNSEQPEAVKFRKDYELDTTGKYYKYKRRDKNDNKK